MSSSGEDPLKIGLVALFVTSLVVAQVTASKLLAFSLPLALPVVGSQLVMPGSAVAYALTFFASDSYTELYGRRAATVVVNVGFAMNFVLLGLVWSTIYAPGLPAAAQPIEPAAFRQVLAASTGIVAASLAAYVVSQNWDVFVFHAIGEFTDGDHLWLRNIGSTASSQLLDTVIFISIAFVVFGNVSLSGALALIIGQYLLKLAIALVDTPFVYAVVAFARGREQASRPTPW